MRGHHRPLQLPHEVKVDLAFLFCLCHPLRRRLCKRCPCQDHDGTQGKTENSTKSSNQLIVHRFPPSPGLRSLLRGACHCQANRERFLRGESAQANLRLSDWLSLSFANTRPAFVAGWEAKLSGWRLPRSQVRASAARRRRTFYP